MKRILIILAALALTIGGQARAETAEQNNETAEQNKRAVAQLAAKCSVNFELTYAISEKAGRPETFFKDLSQYFFLAAEKFDSNIGSYIVATNANNIRILNGTDQKAIENIVVQIKSEQESCKHLKHELDNAFERYE